MMGLVVSAMQPPHRRVAGIVCAAVVAALLCGGAAKAQGGSNNQILYELMNRINQLEREIRQLRGDLEQSEYRQRDLARRLEAFESGAAAAVTPPPPEGTGGAAAPGDRYPGRSMDQRQEAVPPPQRQPGVPDPISSARSEQDVYDEAFNSLRQGNYEEAIAKFEAFLAAYPAGLLSANAQYWLGETYYVVRDYPKARDAFVRLGAEHPKSDKLPEAMLKLGYIYEVLGDKHRARQVFQKLIQTYPNSRAANEAEVRLRAI